MTTVILMIIFNSLMIEAFVDYYVSVNNDYLEDSNNSFYDQDPGCYKSTILAQYLPCLSDPLKHTPDLKLAEVAMWSGGMVVSAIAIILMIALNMLKRRALRQQDHPIFRETMLETRV